MMIMAWRCGSVDSNFRFGTVTGRVSGSGKPGLTSGQRSTMVGLVSIGQHMVRVSVFGSIKRSSQRFTVRGLG
ncbi:hypothetical protein Hanom_Chr02g00111441 [Helianthus anomalus]